MDEVGESSSGINGRCLSLNEVSISLEPSVVTTKILSKLCLFGKIISARTFIAKDVEFACSSLWNTRVRVEPTDGVLAGANCFRFIFESGVVCKRILEQGPWCVKGDMLALLSWSSGFGANTPSFNSIRFWIQIHLLPQDYYSKTNANMLGTLAGKVLTIELEESKPVTWKKWIRVLVEVDVNRPLCCDCYFKTISGVNRWIQLKYEKLGVFCFKCGLLGHQRSECSLFSPVTVLNEKGVPFPLFEPWLNTLSKYECCFSVKRTDVAAGKIKEKTSGALVVGGAPADRELDGGTVVVCQVKGPTPLLEKGAIPPTMGAGPLTRAEASRSMRRRSSRGQRGSMVRLAWRPKVAGVKMATGLHLGVHSFSPKLYDEKPSAHFPFKEPILNLEGGDEENTDEGLRCHVNRDKRLTPLVDHVAHKEVGPAQFNSFFKSGGPLKLFHNGPIGPSLGLRVNTTFNSNGHLFSGPSEIGDGSGLKSIQRKIGGPGTFGDGPVNNNDLYSSPVTIFAKEKEENNINATSVLGQEYSEHLDEKRALSKFFQAQEGYLHELAEFATHGPIKRKAGFCDIGVQPTSEINERTTPVKKRRLDVESHSLKTEPKWNLRRVKGVVRDFPRGVGPRGNEPDGSSELPGDSEEPSSGDGSSPTDVSVGQPSLIVKPISAGQSLRLTAWKARASF
ncbi:hypothetical protein G4B88_014679 [Cannabis sativa]|uniref:CCHC-type domain-containing protein n=1 Tax=Cannabis sativa TaxID=3483 RepID=A0A7J6I9H7_CANSA|nr:hypothetical protein G4B88_014679 [Cannabis sativa]